MATKKIRREADGTVGSINDAQFRALVRTCIDQFPQNKTYSTGDDLLMELGLVIASRAAQKQKEQMNECEHHIDYTKEKGQYCMKCGKTLGRINNEMDEKEMRK